MMPAAAGCVRVQVRQGSVAGPMSRPAPPYPGDGSGPAPRGVLGDGASEHVSVMLDEVVEAVGPRPGGCYVDCTFGRGGHTRALLDRIGPAGRVLAVDRDPQAVEAARELARSDPRLSVHQACFGAVGAVVGSAGLAGGVDAVLMDLGVSSPQLDDPGRGFSFLHDGPLDMRMDPGAGVSAAEWLAGASGQEIGRVLRELGEERAARRIARAIVAARERDGPIASTRQLAALVAGAVPRGAGPAGRDRTRTHPATRTFQAIRLHVNDELGALARGLAAVPALLAPGGRLVVLSFHSLEDRIVKRFMRGDDAAPMLPRRLPVTGTSPSTGAMIPLGAARRPREGEVASNPRSRSAVLRVAERSG